MSNGADGLARDVVNAVSEHGQTLQQVRAPYSTAVSVQVPRDLATVRKRLMEEAAIGGESFFYGWGAGKNHIEGPSIHLAMAAARCWGNCAVFPEPVQDGGDSWIFTTAFVDLETGFTLQRQFRQSKRSIVHGDYDTERKDDIRFQIGQSKASRNVVVNAIPKTIINEAMATAKKGVRDRLAKWIAAYDKEKGSGKGLAAAQDHALEALKRLGIEEERVLAKLSRPTRAALTLDDLILLKGDVVALEEGTDRVESLYPGPEAEGAVEDVMDHLADGAEGGDDSEPKPQPDPPSGGGEEAKKPASRKRKGKPAAATPPPEAETPQGDPEGQSEMELGSDAEDYVWSGEWGTAEFLAECEAGNQGPEIQEAAQEYKARFGRLQDDPLAISKYEPNWDQIKDLQGDAGVTIVRDIRALYWRMAREAGFAQPDKVRQVNLGSTDGNG